MARYWVELRAGEQPLGAAFYLARRYVVTAAHCLTGLPGGQNDVTIAHEDGTTVKGRVCERAPEVDLALVHVVDRSPVRPPVLDRCAEGDLWRAPSRPTASDPVLAGRVVEPSTRHQCAGGTEVEAMQLLSDTELGDYSGYSGGPVERRVREEPTVAGLLIEQYPDRAGRDRATNVLFAITLDEVMRHFEDYFHMPNLRTLGVAPAKPPATDTARMMAGHTEVLRNLAAWDESGLMPAAEIQAIRMSIQRSVIEHSLNQGATW
ncbi:S1 family peptidase [Actinokineospora globicatena]|uniref:Trypsin n=1 Tax=Actinokineospora globicatena TaxID=103729 RepID=A0A9W6V9E0_9PSEU|nr:serine protease [Actinokineospora globicatena]GLW93212.1 hypothetical protein Aglo03_40280 [Actinokineospora globicatena]